MVGPQSAQLLLHWINSWSSRERSARSGLYCCPNWNASETVIELAAVPNTGSSGVKDGWRWRRFEMARGPNASL